MCRSISVVLLLSFLTIVPACGTFKRDFEPPLREANEQVEVAVRSLKLKKGRLRIWADLINKTDQTLLLRYSDFQARSGGRVYPGALRVPFVRVTKEFEMPPHFHKRLSQPVEFEGVGEPVSIEFAVENIRVQGQEGSSSVSVQVPVMPGQDPE